MRHAHRQTVTPTTCCVTNVKLVLGRMEGKSPVQLDRRCPWLRCQKLLGPQVQAVPPVGLYGCVLQSLTGDVWRKGGRGDLVWRRVLPQRRPSRRVSALRAAAGVMLSRCHPFGAVGFNRGASSGARTWLRQSMTGMSPRSQPSPVRAGKLRTRRSAAERGHPMKLTAFGQKAVTATREALTEDMTRPAPMTF